MVTTMARICSSLILFVTIALSIFATAEPSNVVESVIAESEECYVFKTCHIGDVPDICRECDSTCQQMIPYAKYGNCMPQHTSIDTDF